MKISLDISAHCVYNETIDKGTSPKEENKMMINKNNKFSEAAEYFYNTYIDMYCIIGTTFSAEDLSDLQDMFESADLLKKVEMPEYITEDYDEPEW